MKWALGTIALLIAGLLLRLTLLVYAMYVLLGVLLLSRFFTRQWISALEARRFSSEDILEIGGGTEIKTALRNTGRMVIPWLLLEDALPLAALRPPAGIKSQGARLALDRLRPNESYVLSYRVEFLRRGYYQIGPLLAETGDVFGLHRRFRVLTEPAFVLVLPKTLPLEGYNLASRRPIGEMRLAHRLFEDPARIAGIRPYCHGDPLNQIHWRATARVGELQTRICESTCVAGATFILDFHADSLSSSSAELAIVAVASIANAVCLLGQQLAFISNGRDAADRIREEGWRAEFLTRKDAQQRATEMAGNERLRPVIIEAAKGEEHLAEILAALARLESTDGMEFSALLREAAPRIRRDTTAVAVLGRVTPESAAALGDLARSGAVVTALVVSFGMDEIPDWAQPPDWAAMLLDQRIDFRIISSEESISRLCTEALIR